MVSAIDVGLLVDYDSESYWQGCEQRRLLISHCRQCGNWMYYARSVCPRCWSDQVTADEVSGHGAIYTFTVHRSATGPYPVGLIELVEQDALRIVAPLINGEPDGWSIGQPVRLTWVDYRGLPVPAFEPDPATSGSAR